MGINLMVCLTFIKPARNFINQIFSKFEKNALEFALKKGLAEMTKGEIRNINLIHFMVYQIINLSFISRVLWLL